MLKISECQLWLRLSLCVCLCVSVPSNKRKMIKESSRAMPIHRAAAAEAVASSGSQPV